MLNLKANSLLQEKILQQYLHLHRHPTIKYIAENTRIQPTRVFRILKGHEMKLSEYEKFLESINKVLSLNTLKLPFNLSEELTSLLSECKSALPTSSLTELQEMMERKLKINSITQGKKVC